MCGGPEENRRALDALRRGGSHPALVRGEAGPPVPLAFVLPGQGSQLPGMGRALYEAHPVFAETLDAVFKHLEPDVQPVMWGDAPALLNQTKFTQPALFAFQVALYRLLESWDIVPDRLIGHSVGELTAAHLSGVFSLEDACHLVSSRASVMQKAPPGGAMIAVQAPEREVAESIAAYTGPGRAGLGAVNSPGSAVLSGDEEAVTAIAEQWRERGRRIRRLEVSHAFHSQHMDPILACFQRTVAEVAAGVPLIPLVSNLTGEIATVDELRSPAHWAGLVRGTVRFGAGVETLLRLGTGRFLELSPRPTLLQAIGETAGRRRTPALIPALRPDLPEPQALARAVATVHVGGGHVDWTRFLGRGPHADLPTYAFQRKRAWIEDGPRPTGPAVAVTDAGADAGAEETGPGDLRDTLAAAPPERRETLLLDLLRGQLAAVLGHDEAVGADTDLMDLGLTSFAALEVMTRLRTATGLELSPAELYDNPTSRALARHLATTFAEGTGT
nr:acyltransferase domain-containing protein [Actinomadura rubrisoli]